MKQPHFSLFFSPLLLFLTVLCPSVCAKEYTMEDCKMTIENLANQTFFNVSKVAPTFVLVHKSETIANRLEINGIILPEAYLLALETNGNATRDECMTKEVIMEFLRNPAQPLAGVDCPHSLDNKEELEQFKTSLLNAVSTIDIYAHQHIITPFFRDFMRRLKELYDDEKVGFAEKESESLPRRYSMKTVWSIRERFTDYSYSALRISFDYCGYFVNQSQSSEEEINQKRIDCLEKHARRFQFVLQIKNNTPEDISREVATKAKQLNQAIFIYMKALIAEANNKSI